jgi:predicted component of type VI protein secretion system
MMLRYRKKDGALMDFELSERPITIGRGADADLVIHDEKASRQHCGLRLWNGDFYLKDLESKNGTYVNGQRIEMARLNPGDTLRVGSTVFNFEQDIGKGTQTVLKEVENEMAAGKGYTTILREIIQDVDDAPTPPPDLDAIKKAPAPTDLKSRTDATPTITSARKVIKLKIGKQPPRRA